MKTSSMAASRVLVLAFLSIFAISSQSQPVYPNKPIRFVIPYSGGAIDTLARLLGSKLQEKMGQPIIVESRPGANAVLGTDYVAKAAPDGYTFLMVLTTHVISPSLIITPFDPIKDFEPVSTVAAAELGLSLHPSVPAKNLQELIALAKANPGALNYATTQVGGNQHLAGELFGMITGAKFTAIPYKGAGEAFNAVIGGHAQIYLGNIATMIPFIRSEKVRGIAVSGELRSPALPQMPTFSEAGVPNFDVRVWYGLLAPAGTPKSIVEKMSAAIASIIATPEFKQVLSKQGMDPLSLTPDKFGLLMRTDYVRYKNVITAANIKVEN